MQPAATAIDFGPVVGGSHDVPFLPAEEILVKGRNESHDAVWRGPNTRSKPPPSATHRFDGEQPILDRFPSSVGVRQPNARPERKVGGRSGCVCSEIPHCKLSQRCLTLNWPRLPDPIADKDEALLTVAIGSVTDESLRGGEPHEVSDGLPFSPDAFSAEPLGDL